MRAHQRGLWRFARLLGAPFALAEDLVQDALLAGLHKHVERKPEAEAAAWLRGAVKNLWRAHLRRASRRPPHVDFDEIEAEFAARVGDDGGDDHVEATRRCLEGLDGRARRALELRYAENASREDMGRELGIGADGVKSLLRRLRQLVQECVDKRLESER